MGKHRCIQDDRLKEIDQAIKEFYRKAEAINMSHVEIKKDLETINKKLDNGITGGLNHITKLLEGTGENDRGLCLQFAILQNEHKNHMQTVGTVKKAFWSKLGALAATAIIVGAVVGMMLFVFLWVLKVIKI